MCVHEILKRERRLNDFNSPILLTDGEDPYQLNGDCRLHHYEKDDVVNCIEALSYRRAEHKQPVQIAFIGESILRYQYSSFLRVSLMRSSAQGCHLIFYLNVRC